MMTKETPHITVAEISLMLKESLSIREKTNEKIILSDSPKEMHADVRKTDFVMNRKNWSPSRKADYDYYDEVLKEEKRDQVLLDVGAGTGLYRNIFSQFKYIGLDLYPYDIVNLVADIRKELPLKDGVVDIVMLSNVLEHTPTPHILVNESFRVLKQGGRFVGSVPFLAHVHQEQYDYFRYTHYMLERMFQEAGFIDVKVVPLEKPVDFYVWANRRFFDALLYRSNIKGVKKLLAWTAYKFQRLIEVLFRSVFEETQQTYQLARRFGFSARKPAQ